MHVCVSIVPLYVCACVRIDEYIYTYRYIDIDIDIDMYNIYIYTTDTIENLSECKTEQGVR